MDEGFYSEVKVNRNVNETVFSLYGGEGEHVRLAK